MNLRIILLVVNILYPVFTEAQSSLEEISDSLLHWHLHEIDAITNDLLNNPDRYIVGKLYIPQGTMDNHPYLNDYSWKSGWVELNNEKYAVQMMKYDIEKDALIVMETIGTLGYPIQLSSRIIRKFTIDDRQFIYLECSEKPGYYEEIFSGQITVWARWKKTNSNPIGGVPKYAGRLVFLIDNDQNYFEVKTLKDFYEAVTDRKAEIKVFKRKNKLRFRSDKLSTLRQLAEYYTMLKNK